MRPLRPLLALLALLVVVPAAVVANPSTHARVQRHLVRSKFLWATVNFCDTLHHPNAMGVRVSMPGTFSNSKLTMYARIRVDFFRKVKPRGWRRVAGRAGDSGWFFLGNARLRSRQAGRTFPFNPDGFRFRAVVSFAWRYRATVRYFARELTSAGHRDAQLGDPRGHSTVTCVIGTRKRAAGRS